MSADIDIDFADRNTVLKLIRCIPARQMHDGKVRKHNSGVYVTDIPYDPINECAAIDYNDAEQRGYFKLDLLNMSVYQSVRDQAHYDELLATTPDWNKFNNDKDFFEKLVHVANHWDTLKSMPEPVDTIPRLAMFLAIIRPGKRHLIRKTWKDVAATVWEATTDGYSFKKSHAISYAVLVTLHMNIIDQSSLPA